MHFPLQNSQKEAKTCFVKARMHAHWALGFGLHGELKPERSPSRNQKENVDSEQIAKRSGCFLLWSGLTIGAKFALSAARGAKRAHRNQKRAGFGAELKRDPELGAKALFAFGRLEGQKALLVKSSFCPKEGQN